MRWFRRKLTPTPEEIYIKELNEAAERRESRPPDPHVPGQWLVNDQIRADKINFPTLWNHDPYKPIVLPEDFRAISYIPKDFDG